jgi:hypothetical protein
MIKEKPLSHAEHLVLAKEFHSFKRELNRLRGRYMKTHRGVVMRLRPFEEALDKLRSASDDEHFSGIQLDFYPY